jgi:two-component system, cell cycle sensor histidine kinase and response regulator CckA
MNSHDRRSRPDEAGGASPNSERAAIDGIDAPQARSDGLHTAFVDDMADGIAFHRAIRDDTGHIVDFLLEYANQAFGRLADRAHDELVGRRMLELFPAWADGLFDICVQAVETGQPQIGESLPKQRGLEWANANGRTPSVEISISKLGDGCAISLRDVTARQRVEDELFRSQAMLRSVLDTFPQRVFWKDLNSIFVGCNAAFARHIGLADPSEIVGIDDFRIHAPDDAERYRADDREITRSGIGRIEYEEPMTRTDGTDGWARTSKVPIRDKDGEVIGLLGAYQDITDQKRAQEALRESERFLDSVIENIPVMVFVKDAVTFRFVRLNKAGERILGYPRERLINQDSSDLVPPEEEAHFHASDRLVATTGQAVEIPEETITNPEMGLIVMHTIKVPLFGDGGQVRYVLGISEDITARKAAEQGRRESEERYRHIIDAITNYIVSVRIAHGAPVSVNHGPGSVAITGYTPEELNADPDLWDSLVLPEDRELVEESTRRILTGVRIAPIEYRLRRKDGVVRWVRETLVLRFDSDGAPTAYDGLIEDITEPRILQNQLLQAQKMEGIGRLAGGVAHDFNNLLTAILGYVEMCHTDLPPELPPDHPARLDLQEVAAAGERAASLTRQLLTFASRQIVAPERLDINSLVGDLLKMLQRLLGDDIEIETSLASDLRTVVADPGQIQQLLVNLTVNARDAMPHGGRLMIEAANEMVDPETAKAHPGAVPGPHVLLAVTDTGEGMTEEVRSRLFEPFFTTKGPGKGSGLGLATCHGIVKQLSGHMEVYSEPGQGTMFRIHLPSQGGPADPRPIPPSAPLSSEGTETVLVVEDEPRVRQLAVLGLRARGYTVLEAANGADAIRVAIRTGNAIDLIVSDVMMPGMSGPTLIRELSVLAPRARALLMSGHADSAILDEAPELGHAFLAKPYTPERLARKVREILDAPAE